MKKLLLLVTLLFSFFSYSQSYHRYVRWEKITTVQRDAIDTSDALVTYQIYNTDTQKFQFWNGTSWEDINGTSSGGSSTYNTTNTVFDFNPFDSGSTINDQLFIRANGANVFGILGDGRINVFGNILVPNNATVDGIELSQMFGVSGSDLGTFTGALSSNPTVKSALQSLSTLVESTINNTSTNTTNISGNTSSITINSGNISTNATNIAGKQDLLVSGVNLKTINGESLLGSTDITVSGGGQVNTIVAGTNITVDNTDPANPVINSTASGGGSNPFIFPLTNLSELSNTGNSGNIYEIQSDFTLTSNLTIASGIKLIFTTGQINLNGFELIGTDNTEYEIQGEGVAIDAFTGTISGTWKTPNVIHFNNFGAVSDFQKRIDGNISAGSNVLTSLTANWTAADVGKPIIVENAGSATTWRNTLITTIQSVTDANTVVLADAATNNAFGVDVLWGSDNFQAGMNFWYMRNQRAGRAIIDPGHYWASTRERINGDFGTRNPQGWVIGNGTNDIDVYAYDATLQMIPNDLFLTEFITFFDTDRYRWTGGKLIGDIDYHRGLTEFPALINFATAAYNGRVQDLNVTKSIGDGLLTKADDQFVNYIQGANTATILDTGVTINSRVDASGNIVADPEYTISTDLLSLTNGVFQDSENLRGFPFFSLTGGGTAGWAGMARPLYYASIYDENGNWILNTDELDIYQHIEIREGWAQIRINLKNVVNPDNIDLRIRPSLHARGLILDNVNVSYCGRQGASNLAYDLTWVNSDIHNNGGIDPGAGIDIEDQRRSARNYHFENLRFWDNEGGDIILVGTENVTIKDCWFLRNTRPNWGAPLAIKGDFARYLQVEKVNTRGKDILLGRNGYASDLTMYGGTLVMYGNGSTATDLDMYNAKITIDEFATSNRVKSTVRNVILRVDENWTGELLSDRNSLADWENIKIYLNDISRLSPDAIAGVTTNVAIGTGGSDLWENQSPQGGVEYGGSFRGFEVYGDFIANAQHDDFVTAIQWPVAHQMDDIIIEGGLEIKHGLPKDVSMKRPKISGFMRFELDDFEDVDNAATRPTIVVEDGEFIIRNGQFAWTNNGAYLIETEDKNVNFEFKRCKFIIEVPYTTTGGAQKFFKFNHFGTTLLEDCYFETAELETIDFSNGSVSGATNGPITVIKPRLHSNTSMIAGPGDTIRYEVQSVNNIFPDANGNITISGGGSGDMLSSLYDPQNIAADAFDRSNHTGTITSSVVSDFNTAVSSNTDVAANTAKVGITTQQANDILANNAKVGITTQQAADIITNNGKISAATGTFTGSTIDMTDPKGYQTEAVNNSTSYTTTNEVVGSWRLIWINAPSEPTFTNPDAEKIPGAEFTANTDMYMVVHRVSSTRTDYYFLTR